MGAIYVNRPGMIHSGKFLPWLAYPKPIGFTFRPNFYRLLIYNVTYKIEREIHGPWLKFFERDYLPVVMETNTVDSYQLTRLLGVDESDGLTYCLLLNFSSRPAFNIYQQNHALSHQKMLDGQFKGKFVSFPSMLDVVLAGK